MVSRTWLFGLLLAVPLIGFGVAEAIQSHFNSELRSVLEKEYPEATEQQLAQVTVDRLCEDPSPELRDLCDTNSNLNLMSRGALGAGAVGLSLLLLISLAGRLARNSRRLLVVLFAPGLYLAAVTLIGLILVHAAVAMAAIYYGESALVGRIHVGVIAAIGLGALAGVLAIARGTFSLVRKAQTLGVCRTCPRFISASGAHIECLGFFAGVFAFSWRSDIELRAILGLTQATIPRQPPIRRNGGHASA